MGCFHLSLPVEYWIPMFSVLRLRRAFPCILFAKNYVSNMDKWMAVADCVVTRAGSIIIAEAMVRGLPIMLTGFSRGQEVRVTRSLSYVPLFSLFVAYVRA